MSSKNVMQAGLGTHPFTVRHGKCNGNNIIYSNCQTLAMTATWAFAYSIEPTLVPIRIEMNLFVVLLSLWPHTVNRCRRSSPKSSVQSNCLNSKDNSLNFYMLKMQRASSIFCWFNHKSSRWYIGIGIAVTATATILSMVGTVMFLPSFIASSSPVKRIQLLGNQHQQS